MGRMASEITSLTIVYSTVYSGADWKKKTRKKHQSSASLTFVRGFHRWQRASNADNVSMFRWRHHQCVIRTLMRHYGMCWHWLWHNTYGLRNNPWNYFIGNIFRLPMGGKLITQGHPPSRCWHITTRIMVCHRTMEPHQQTQFPHWLQHNDMLFVLNA